MRYRIAITIAFSAATLLTSLQTARADVPSFPADDDPFANPTLATPARSHFHDSSLVDPEGNPVPSLTVATSVDGRTQRIWSEDYPGADGTIKYLSYYLHSPYDGQAYLEFSIANENAWYAGYSSLFSWNDSSSGNVHYMLEAQVNGQYHSEHVVTDAAGNIRSEQEVKHQAPKGARTDRCKIIADWGALQCPSHFDAPKNIPIQVRAALSKVWSLGGFFTGVFDVAKVVVKKVGEALSDPTVQRVLEIAVVVIATVGCCAGAAGYVCAGCVMSGIQGVLSIATDPPAPANLSSSAAQLRASGQIMCTDGALCSPVNYSYPPDIR